MRSRILSRRAAGMAVLVLLTTAQLTAGDPWPDEPCPPGGGHSGAVDGRYYEVSPEFESGPPLPTYPHYDKPSRFYGLWFRPRDFGLNNPERCTYSTFRPRGMGNVFAEPRTCERMDYVPYTPRTPISAYGPAYYARLRSPYCDDFHCFYPETYNVHGPDCKCHLCD